jgi:hypothetical protein
VNSIELCGVEDNIKTVFDCVNWFHTTQDTIGVREQDGKLSGSLKSDEILIS